MRLKEKYGSSCMERFDTSKTTVMTKLSLEDQWIFYINSDNGLYILYIVCHLVLVLLFSWGMQVYCCLLEEHMLSMVCTQFKFQPFSYLFYVVATHLCWLSIIRNTCYFWKALMGHTSTHPPLLKNLGYEYKQIILCEQCFFSQVFCNLHMLNQLSDKPFALSH